MTRLYLSFLLMLSSISAHAQLSKSDIITPPALGNIDQYDSVVFDLSQAVVASGYVEFPVYFKTDDVIYALDFSLKYNHNKYIYDTIIDLTTYLLDNSYYNPFDSTIRFTSSSLTPIPNMTPLVKIRFDTVLTSVICQGDIYALKGYLNGDQCSVKLIDCSPLSVDEPFFAAGYISVYPVPASDWLYIRFRNGLNQSLSLFLSDMTGRTVRQSVAMPGTATAPLSLYVNDLSPGAYVLHIQSDEQIYTTRILISR